MTVNVILQNTDQFIHSPHANMIATWLSQAMELMTDRMDKNSVTIRLIDEAESMALNQQHGGKDKPTNVLSFPDQPIPGVKSYSFGDLAICVPLVLEEAVAQHKIPEAHFAHLIIHGFLHLNGYDHIKTADARLMENLEVLILSMLGYDNPY